MRQIRFLRVNNTASQVQQSTTPVGETGVGTIKEKAKEIYESVKDKFSNAADGLGRFNEDTKDTLMEKAHEGREFISDSAESVKEKARDLKDRAGSNVKSFGDSVQNEKDKIKAGVGQKTAEGKEFMSSKFDAAKKATWDAENKAKTGVKGAGDNLKHNSTELKKSLQPVQSEAERLKAGGKDYGTKKADQFKDSTDRVKEKSESEFRNFANDIHSKKNQFTDAPQTGSSQSQAGIPGQPKKSAL